MNKRLSTAPVNTAGRMALLLLIIFSMLALACMAARPMNRLPSPRVDAPVVQVTLTPPSPALQKEINEQTNESNGIILAGIVIVLIILGGTFAATRRKAQ